MATLLLSAAGASFGASTGASILGMSLGAVGRIAGASLGRVIDQRVMGQGTEAVETGRVERFRLSGASEGAPIPQVFGRMRVGGQVIWASEFAEHVETEGGGGKGSPPQPKVRSFSYTVSLALALCEGEITGVNRVWADGAEIAVRDLNLRVYKGRADQLPDPVMEAIEGAGNVPAYRGTAYVVIEDLDLGRFGNRVPQFSVEVTRPSLEADALPQLLRGVAMLPGTGEYTLAPTQQHMRFGDDAVQLVNINTPSEETDLATSLRMMRDELPNVGAVSLVVSWFGDDLCCGMCRLRPKVEQRDIDAEGMPWQVAGLDRSEAGIVPRLDGRVIYGGTPADAAVTGAIRALRDAGQAVLYYPFILMEQLAANGLRDPWAGRADQPVLPWRGRITASVAPGRTGTPDGTAAARAEVEAFFGTARAEDFEVEDGKVNYTGPDEWSFRRFILHNAALCVAAGGVDSFCIGSEMRGLTQIRDDLGFPAVMQLKRLAAEARALLGPGTKLGYAADWSEYFGYHPTDGSGDVYFHLDPLWADSEIDFVGIDNYMPLSDWRDGDEHADASRGAIHDLGYLQANIEGGEGFDWYYRSAAERDAQTRAPITDGAFGEDWVYRYKDIRRWWSQPHHERIGGVRQASPTPWIPCGKPIWLTELGCPAVDKGTNQPNVFLDPKSSESFLPYHSSGQRDELIQHQYLRAMHLYWSDPEKNPASSRYDGRMIDISRMFVWAWDARPYPWFPAQSELWADGANWRQGHWITGRSSARTLASVVTEICARAGLEDIDVSALHGYVRGYVVTETGDARRALQPLMLVYGFDAIERGGRLVFRNRGSAGATDLDKERLALSAEDSPRITETREAEAEMAGRVRLRFFEADGDHETVAEETVLPDDATHAVSESDAPLSLTRGEGRAVVERWLSEARLARDTVRFTLPPSRLELGAGDVVSLNGTRFRIDRAELTDRQEIEAVRIDPAAYRPSDFADAPAKPRPFVPAVPVAPLFLDLPLMRGGEVPHAPHVALTATPWPGSVAIFDSASDEGYGLNQTVSARSVVGLLETPLPAAPAGRVDRGAPVQIRLFSGALQSVTEAAFLAGGNLLAIGDGTSGAWELIQFRDAELMAERRWRVSHRLRGQFGTDGVVPEVWPAGSKVVRIDGRLAQIALAASERRQERHYRIGPASRPLGDPSYVHLVRAFDGVGLRPYAPAHLRAVPNGQGLAISWIRRTRIDGDDWSLAEVPLGEESEAYLLRVSRGGRILREVQTSAPTWAYGASEVAADLSDGDVTLSVAQISARFGPGPAAQIAIARP
ncbi:gene transfer agent protein [Roseivivax halodurans JCM 10272]|uniref:Gene transfer agent protein n=1 Tax=Roseivivax halodurans JCM 10272 TaxID=1449350 RepID=X7ELX9_9RHOB|nr:glycoside hydrolase/phage tail family protein [Roseivivax halodurans]ETX16173.1 gene transfer agent protein [Roseivivax halodurans JCM 10272]